jgi:hypothetical protein
MAPGILVMWRRLYRLALSCLVVGLAACAPASSSHESHADALVAAAILRMAQPNALEERRYAELSLARQEPLAGYLPHDSAGLIRARNRAQHHDAAFHDQTQMECRGNCHPRGIAPQ